MFLPSNVVENRARALVRIKLVFDLALVVAFYASGAPLPLLLVPVADLGSMALYLRYIKRWPAALTMLTLTLSAALLAVAPQGLGTRGGVLWVLYPLLPLGAGFVLGRRSQLWQVTAITTLAMVAGTIPTVRSGQPVVLDQVAIGVLLVALTLSIWATSWFTDRTLSPEAGGQELLGEPLSVVRGVMVVPFNWVIGGVQEDRLSLELHELKRRHNPRWIVLDLAPAGDLGRHDLLAIDHAATAVSTSQCTVVLARAPVDALGHLDVAQPLVGRIERFATAPQAVEAGLRRLGWTQEVEQAQRIVTHF